MKVSIILASIAVVVLVGAAVSFFLMNTSKASLTCSTLSQKPSIIAIGDSLVEGYGAPKGSDFVTKLSARIGVPIENYGRSGDTSAQGLARARDITVRPDIVIILLGGNDALQKIPTSTTKENLSKLIELFQSYQSKRIHVVLVGVLGGFPNDPFSPMFKDLQKQYGVTYVPNILSGLFGNQSYMSDQVHPNEAGYEKIAERMEQIVNEVCAQVGQETK